ncbi:MAG: hypothetical protein IPL58_16290 [Betaproteobacteria bacterium]|uniref:Uncharacterized protein n=1 Tax=Candidatus Proximibacter danicus TaxID=2954365 RepID=A0A9D7K4Q5_9PROT|nr:hypothetical protein [Candidatus Proximibacter danicus]
MDALGLPLFDCSDFLRAAHVAFSLSAPPYIAAYLADELPSQSLPDDVLRHLCGWRQHQVEKAEAPEEDAALSSYGDFIEADFSYDPGAVRSDQVKVINTVIKFLETKYEHPISKIDQEIQRHGTGLWPVTRLLIEWTKWLLGGNDGDALNFGRKPIRKSSAVRYLRTIGRHLITLAGDENLLEMEAEDLESLYELSAARVIQR